MSINKASVVCLVCVVGALIVVSGQSPDSSRRHDRFTDRGQIQSETVRPDGHRHNPTEALTGFDNVTNGLDPQGPPFASLDEDTVVPLRSFNDNRFIFEEVETTEDGLGPTYNAQSCRECHQNVATGGASQVAEHRTGRLTQGAFFEAPGGSLIQSRATHADIVERPAFEDDISTLRISTNTLGNGYIEAISNDGLMNIRNAQPPAYRGTALNVAVLELPGASRIGRFGWKSQHGSLLSFSADAYLNEMGITSPLFPDENTSAGRDVGPYDTVEDPENDGIDVRAFANFMRATKAPPRGPITETVIAGEAIFQQIGCATCHTPTIVTAATGAVLAGYGKVPEAIGYKIVHPYSQRTAVLVFLDSL